MNQDENKITQLQAQVAELMAWKEERTRQQLKYPLDTATLNILKKYFLRTTGKVYRQLGSDIFVGYFTIQQDDSPVSLGLMSERNLIQFSVNISTDVVTFLSGIPHDGDAYTPYTSGILPDSLWDYDTLFIINSSGNTCKFSDTLGGSPLDITSLGVGSQYLLNVI